MKGDRIPDQDHVARFCKASTVDNGKIQATAFMVRKYEESLSINWLEILSRANRQEELTTLRKIYEKKNIRLAASGKIAIMNVGEVVTKVLTESSDRRNIEVLHDPTPLVDPSHSGIYNLRYDDEEIAELILEMINESYPSRA